MNIEIKNAAYPVFQDIPSVLLDTLDTMVVVFNDSGTISFINKRAITLFGERYPHVAQADWFELCVPEQVTHELKSLCVDALNDKNIHTYACEYSIHCMNTGDRLVSWDHAIYSDTSGEIRIIAFGDDITEKLEKEKALRDSEKLFKDLYENAPNPYLSVSGDFSILDCNISAEELFKYKRDELIGRPVSLLFVDLPETDEKSMDAFRRLDHSHQTDHSDVEMRASDDSRMWVDLTVNAVLDSNDNIIRYRFSITDITKRKFYQEEREKLISELQAALGQVKKLSGLLPICSHCKKIRDDAGYWNQLEEYISEHSEASFSHSICSECLAAYYPAYHPKKDKGS